MTDRTCIGNDVVEGEGQPLYAERTPDAPPVTWAHRMCLEPLPPSVEEIEAQAAALKAWAEELRNALAVLETIANRTPLERQVAIAKSPA